MTDQLKPCPFCGSDSLLSRKSPSYYWIFCCGCRAKGPLFHNEEGAITKWNTRHTLEVDTLKAENKRLRDELEIIKNTSPSDSDYMIIRATMALEEK